MEKKKSQEESTALKSERKLSSNWFIITPEGELSEIKNDNGKVKGFDFSQNKKNKHS